MKILAIDASTKSSGWCIFENENLTYYDCITASSKDMIERVKKMVNNIDAIINRYKPDKIILEEVRPEQGKNIKTYKALMYLQAAIAFLVHDNFKSIELDFIYPSEWRASCGISNGRGIKREQSKKADIIFVNDKFNLDVTNDDIADAIGLGWGYINKQKEVNWE